VHEKPETLAPERWASWVMGRRFGGDRDAASRSDEWVGGIRAQVMELAAIQPGDVVVDVNARDGFFILHAAALTGARGRVIVVEQSDELLDVCRKRAAELGVADRCDFVKAAPDDLGVLSDVSVDVVLMRSILCYVPDKAAAIAEYHRVLRPGGRLAFVQMFPRALEPGLLSGFDVRAVEHLAAPVRAVLAAARPVTHDDYDERAILSWLEYAGFRTIDFRHEIEICDTSDWPPRDWEIARRMAAGPDQPTLEEAVDQGLGPADAETLKAHLKVEVEAGRRSVRFPKTFARAVRTVPAPEDARG
jgi:arsenite methyltransferase